MKRIISALLVVGIAVLALLPGGAVAGTTERVSIDSDESEANKASGAPAISADGRLVAFQSTATNLIAVDANGQQQDIFVRDLQTGTTELVSVSSGGVQGNALSLNPAISADGRYVAFYSGATNLVSPATSGWQVFVRDRQAGTTEIVSVNSNEIADNSGESKTPDISADGRYVVFQTWGSNLDLNIPDNNGVHDIYLRDRQAGTTARVSLDSGSGDSDGGSFYAAISADGSFVAFESHATDLVAGDTNGRDDVFVRNISANTTERASVDSDEAQATGGTGGIGSNADISADGRFVAFTSDATNLVPDDVNGLNQDVFVRDRLNGTTELADVDSSEVQAAFGQNREPSISADGRFVAFESGSPDLVPADDNSKVDIFVRDRTAGNTARISLPGSGEANGDSSLVAISGGGSVFAFQSDATNLVTDNNNVTDVFVRVEGDTDSDGVPDFADNCPNVPNGGAQPDTDGDGAGDACDAPGTGNVDCNQAVNAVDALKILRYVAGLSVAQSEPCKDVGQVIGSGFMQGDADCNGTITAVDALKVLRAVAGLPVTTDCAGPVMGPQTALLRFEM